VSVTSCGSDVDVAYKKVGDGHPLRLWKYCVQVPAPPVDVLERLLRERHLWDDDIIKWRVVQRLDDQTEVFQYVVNMMAPHPTRDFCELRFRRRTTLAVVFAADPQSPSIRFVVQLVVQLVVLRIHDKSNQWSWSINKSLLMTVIVVLEVTFT